MSNMHLVTGYAGLPHVTAADMASLYAALFGHGSYVLDRGNRFSATVVSNNSISIASGDLLLQGRHVRIEDGTTVELTIENGASGYKRNDLIVARYIRNSSTGVEEVNLVVLKGTQTTGTPADPAYTTGNIIQDQARLADVPLYRIPLDGLTVGTPVKLFEVKWSVEKQIHDQFLDAAPLDHSSGTDKYGAGTDGDFGHVKLSDSTDSQKLKAANGVAATPYAVYLANKKAADAASAASSAQSTADAAKTAAATAQSTADAAKTAAATAQNAANAATAYKGGSATLNTTTVSGGSVKYHKYGRVVQVNFDVELNRSAISANTVTEYAIATGLPAPVESTSRTRPYIETDPSGVALVRVKSDGTFALLRLYANLPEASDGTLSMSGTITYISAS